MARINDLDEFEVGGGAGEDNNDLYQAMPRHAPHHARHEHHVPDGGATPNNGANARPTVNPNVRANALSDVSTANERVVSPPSAEALDGTTGGKGRRGKKKCSCCHMSPCLCRSGKCKSCGKTGGDCGCMGGKNGVMGGRARSKSKTRAKSKGKRAKSKGKK